MLDNKKFGPWAIITGASSGIGAEFALQLAQCGFNLLLVARREEILNDLSSTLTGRFGIKCITIAVDLSEASFMESIVKATDELDIGLVISNAGTGQTTHFFSLEDKDILKTIQLNSISHAFLAHHFGKKMKMRKSGGIVLVSAMGAENGIPYMSVDAGAKAMVKSLGMGLHTEFKKYGIHVTVLRASPTQTPVLKKLGLDQGLPLRPITTRQCVGETLAALKKNMPIVTPGFKFRLLNWLVPASVSRIMMAKILAKNIQD